MLIRRMRFWTRREQFKLWVLAWATLYVSVLEIVSLGQLTSDVRVNLLMSDWMDD